MSEQDRAAPRTEAARCTAVKNGMFRCKRRATYGTYCFQHAHSIGGWVLVSPATAKARSTAIAEALREREAAAAPALDRLDVERLAATLHSVHHSHWLPEQVTEGHVLGEQEDARLIAAAYSALGARAAEPKPPESGE